MLDARHAGCVLCGPIVESAPGRVKGVSAVKVSQADGNADALATVTFGDSLTTCAVLIKATTGRGYRLGWRSWAEADEHG